MNATLAIRQLDFRKTVSADTVLNEAPGAPKLEKVCRLCRKNRRGAAVVEFAIVAPVFFILVFGMIEYGRMVMVQQILTNASREGARYAVTLNTIDETTTAQVKQRVTDYLTSASINGTHTVDVTPGGSGSNQTVAVAVSMQFGQVSWLPSPMFVSSTMPLQAVSTMRKESTN